MVSSNFRVGESGRAPNALCGLGMRFLGYVPANKYRHARPMIHATKAVAAKIATTKNRSVPWPNTAPAAAASRNKPLMTQPTQ